ncbi:hypothetical protein ACIBCA_29165 [Kitasatospora sp. NPDC051170]|uniref:hypothetical protein n=1 Tax=Kitasatospora sp. NPDC051170 TaxID=3364056 RepID=UPI00378AF058
MPLLPPIGAEIPCSCLAINTPVEYEGKLISVDFRGGIKYRVDPNPQDPMNSVRLRITGFRMSAEFPGANGEPGGTVTLEQNDPDVDTLSRLRLIQQFPPQYEHRAVIPFAATFDIAGKPVILTPKEPMVWVAKLTQFPPRGDIYQLEQPVDLVDPEKPDTVVARIMKFPVKSGGL